MSRRPVDPNQSFPKLEEHVLERWRERDVFAESVRRREGAQPWVFWEGPPTANGRPGAHHVLARAFKDIYPRYKTMRGHYVERKGGWDCHGLPVEIAVEQQLGLHNKHDIEAYGIAEFNAKCRASVFEFLEDWDRLTERIGFWVDLDNAYRTLDNDYIESVWWALRQIYDKGLLYEGHKVVPYCPRCGTALSSHELALGYKDVTDPSVYVRFPVREDGGPLQAGDELLVWTTTPWTLVSNAAVAVDPELIYVRAKTGKLEAPVVLAEALVERVFGPTHPDVQILSRFPGAALDGVAYEPPFPYIKSKEYGERGHTVLLGDFVTAEDGTGLVHTAIAFGEDDFRLGAQYGLNVVNPVRLDGTYDERIKGYEGRFVKDADADLVEDLRRRGRLLKATEYEHSYPHCWRCGTPLLYYAKPSWYIATSRLRDRLLAANEQVTWYPDHVKHGRFGRWLENNVDWALSRERYWGTPLPVWRSDDGEEIHVIGSFAELEELSGTKIEDPHRPYVDDITFRSPKTGKRMRRVPEVIDVWFDSGAMQFAQWHAPFENQDRFERSWPADFVCEALDQTRGWFYSLLAESVLLFDREPYENVVCLGLIVDEEGQKMSKSKGNVVDPFAVLDRFGADAFRWYFFSSKQPWDGYRFSLEAIGEGVRLFLNTLWNTYGFYVLYENAAGEALEAPAGPPTDLDRWVLSRLGATVEAVTDRLDAFDATTAAREIAAFVDDLSNWYVRRSRRRFWDGDPRAFATLREALVTVSRLLAPFTPFVADEIYDNLDGELASVHLTDWPAPRERDRELEAAMATAREAVALGLRARAGAKVGLRRPLRETVVVAAGREREALEALADIVREELNVKALRFVDEADELGSYELKPNYRSLGPRFGKNMPQVAAAVEALDADRVAVTLREGGTVGVNVDGHEHELGPDDLIIGLQPLEGFQVEREGGHAVALDLALDDALRREGLAREVIRAVQNARKDAGLEVSDRIALALGGDAELLDAVREHEQVLAGEVLATSVSYDADGAGAPATVDGRPLTIAVSKA
jgi:isoleucyl-tRNA synthetase